MRRTWTWPALVAVAAAATYAASVGNGFTLDDVPMIEQNPRLAPEASLTEHFTEPYWPMRDARAGLYRPVTSLTLHLNRIVGGGDPFGFHLFNVALHVAASLLAWTVLRRLTGRAGAAAVGALLFAVHPLHVEAVANVVGRAEILVAVFVLVAWSAHARGRIGLASFAYLLALLSKESAILAPVLFALDDRLDGSLRPRRFVGYAAAAVVLFALRTVALGDPLPPGDWFFLDNPAASQGPFGRVLTAAWVQALYGMLFVVPWRLTSDYGYDAIPLVRSMLDPRAWLGLAWLAALGTTVVRGVAVGGRWRIPALGVATWILFLLPSSNLPFAVGTIMGERLTYLPSFGACLIAGHALAALGRFDASRGGVRGPAVATLVALLVLAGAARSADRSLDWKNNASLARADAASTPRAAKAQFGLGIVLMNEGDAEGAERSLGRAVEIWPGYAQAHYNLAELLLRRNDLEGARDHLESAVEHAGGTFVVYDRLAPLYERLGDVDAALRTYEVGLRIVPHDRPFRFNYARLLLAAGRREAAAGQLRRLAAEDPDGVIGGVASGLLAESEGRPADAAAIYRRLLERADLPPDVRSRVSTLLDSVSGKRAE